MTRWSRPAATVGIIFTCYTTLGKLGVTAMPYLVDGKQSDVPARTTV